MTLTRRWSRIQQKTGWPFGPGITAAWLLSPIFLWVIGAVYDWLVYL